MGHCDRSTGGIARLVLLNGPPGVGKTSRSRRYLADHPQLHVLVGDERQLARAIRHGGSGAINGFSNFCAPLLRPMVDAGTEVPAVAALVDLVLEFPVTPAVKALVAHRAGDEGYLRTAPPLVPAEPAARARLAAAFDALPAARSG
jgi:4-hydroxy-tetrahydrodipicolinate synthase